MLPHANLKKFSLQSSGQKKACFYFYRLVAFIQASKIIIQALLIDIEVMHGHKNKICSFLGLNLETTDHTEKAQILSKFQKLLVEKVSKKMESWNLEGAFIPWYSKNDSPVLKRTNNALDTKGSPNQPRLYHGV